MAPWSTSKENRIGLSFPRLRVVKSKLNKSRVPRPLQRRVLSAQASDNRDWATLGDELSPPLPRLLAAGAKASLEREVFDMQMVLYNLTLGLGPSYPSWAGEVGSANPQIKQTSDNLSVIKYQRSSASTAQVDCAISTDDDTLSYSTAPSASPRLIYTLQPASEYASKRSGGTFALIPIVLDGECFLTYTVVNETASFRPSSPDETRKWLDQDEDMREEPKEGSISNAFHSMTARKSIPGFFKQLRNPNLEVFSRDEGSSYNGFTFLEEMTRKQLVKKGKAPMYPNTLNSWKRKRVAVDDHPLQQAPPYRRRLAYVYNPFCAAQFLVGSSTSLTVYPTQGYYSTPSTCRPPRPINTTLLDRLKVCFRIKHQTGESSQSKTPFETISSASWPPLKTRLIKID